MIKLPVSSTRLMVDETTITPGHRLTPSGQVTAGQVAEEFPRRVAGCLNMNIKSTLEKQKKICGSCVYFGPNAGTLVSRLTNFIQ